jgi:hypothetical protein
MAIRGSFLIILLALAPACANFDDIPVGECGNRVVDPGEDCDTFDRGGAACAKPGEPHACRLTCDPDAQSSGCPAANGWSCGADGVCRQPTGTFAQGVVTSDEVAGVLATGDFDGDHSADLLTSAVFTYDPLTFVESPPGATRVHFFGPGGVLETTTSVANTAAAVAVGEVSGDDLADVVVGAGVLSVYRGRADRTLSPQAYASLPLSTNNVYVWAQDVRVGIDGSGDEAMSLSDQIFGSSLFTARDPTSEADLLDDTLPTVEDLRGEVAIAQLRDDPSSSPCEEFALAFPKAILVGTPCTGPVDPKTFDTPLNVRGTPTFIEHTVVELPPGVEAMRVFAMDVDLDGHLDLLVAGLRDEASYELLVAYGRGDMTFDSTVDADPMGPPDNQAATYLPFLVGPALAVGHLNGDGVIDVVTQYLMLVSTPLGFEERFLGPINAHDALIADFNVNGHPDVAVSLEQAPDILFFSGAGDDLFNEATLTSSGPVLAMAVGDFDGDLIPDIAAAQSTGEDAAVVDRLAVSFGRALADPEALVTVGSFDDIRQIATGRFVNPATSVADGRSELGVVSATRAGDLTLRNLAVLYGDANRQLQSPFVLFTRAGSAVTAVHEAVRVAVAELGGDAAHRDLAVLGHGQSVGESSEYEPFRRLWLLDSKGDAELREVTSWPGDPLTTPHLSTCDPLMATLDADADGVDEVVYFTSSFEPDDPNPAKATNHMLVAQVEEDDDGARKLVEAFRAELPELLAARIGCLNLSPAAEQPYAPDDRLIGEGERRVLAEDFDGDGWADLALLGHLPAEPPMSYQATARVVVLWNQGTGAAATSFDAAARAEWDGLPTATAIGSIAVDGDAARELVVVTSDGAFVLDSQDRQLALLQRVDGAGGGLAVLGLDLTRDGLEDIVIGSLDGVVLLPQLAVNP